MHVSIGIGLTNDCNLSCAHCYRPQDRIYQLGMGDVRRICQRLEVSSFNMGTGESWLHPEFPQIVAYLAERGIRMSMASNGYSLNQMPLSLLRQFHDVEVSIDFGTAQGQDAFRGEGNWDCVMAAIDRCRAHDAEVTILATLMNINVQEMDGLVDLARDVGANLRVNVYQPVQHDNFMLSYAEFWEGFRRLLGALESAEIERAVVVTHRPADEYVFRAELELTAEDVEMVCKNLNRLVYVAVEGDWSNLWHVLLQVAREEQ